MKLREKTRSVRPLDSAGRPQPISTLPTGGRSEHSRLVRIYGASINWFMRTSTFLLIPVDSAENEFLSAHPIPHPAGRPCRGSGAGLSAGKPLTGRSRSRCCHSTPARHGHRRAPLLVVRSPPSGTYFPSSTHPHPPASPGSASPRKHPESARSQPPCSCPESAPRTGGRRLWQ